MSFCVAVQSAIFYFVACTPCNKVLHHRKAQIKAKKESEDKARIVAEQPHLYHHPDPFHTNPFWGEEIRMGPSLPKKGKGADGSSKSASQRGLANGSRDLASVGTGSILAISPPPDLESTPSPKTGTTSSPEKPAGIGSCPTIVPDEDAMSATLSKTVSVSTAEGWNHKRYQREDEELWGYEISRTGQKLMDAIKQAGSTAGRFVESKLGIEKQVTEEDRYNFYFSPRNPPVNEYHPPVVRNQPIHKDGLRWMLQPPPPAKVMEGKIPVSRTSSMMSVGSRRTGTSDAMSMGRLVGERALEARLRNGETPYEDGTELQSTSSLPKTRSRRATVSSIRTRSRRTAGSHSLSTDSEDSSEEVNRRRSRRQSRRPKTSDIESENSENEYMSRSLESLSHSAHPGHAAQKPRLPTILSSEATMKTSMKERRSSSRALQDTTNDGPVLEEHGRQV
ncbi:hypothetical protein OQA88_1512 [Cercophora sp. LCS_1]